MGQRFSAEQASSLNESLRITKELYQRQIAFKHAYEEAERVKRDPTSSDEDRRRAGHAMAVAFEDFWDKACSYREIPSPAEAYQELVSSLPEEREWLEKLQTEVNRLLSSQGYPPTEDSHRYYERPMSKKEIASALGLDAEDRKIAYEVNTMFRSWGCEPRRIHHARYLVPLDVMPKHFFELFKRHVRLCHGVDLK